jgi:multidrug efflux pump subunit AcrA (membrane-fusion protein)
VAAEAARQQAQDEVQRQQRENQLAVARAREAAAEQQQQQQAQLQAQQRAEAEAAAAAAAVARQRLLWPGGCAAMAKHLLTTVTKDDVGLVSGQALRELLVRSGLGNGQLGEIWSKADTRELGRLDPDQIVLLLGMIGQAQRGDPVDPATAGLCRVGFLCCGWVICFWLHFVPRRVASFGCTLLCFQRPPLC